VDSVYLFQDTNQWRALVNTALNFGVYMELKRFTAVFRRAQQRILDRKHIRQVTEKYGSMRNASDFIWEVLGSSLARDI
jgi:hypothetical protein